MASDCAATASQRESITYSAGSSFLSAAKVNTSVCNPVIRWKSERPTQPTSSYLSKFSVKLMEIAGAGLASTIAAYLLAQIATPHASPPPLVQVTPAYNEMMRMVRDEHVMLVGLRKEIDDQRKPERVAVAPMAVPVPTRAKLVQAAPLRNQMPERTRPVEAKSRIGEPLPIQPAVVVSQSLPINVEPRTKTMALSPSAQLVSASANAEGEWSTSSVLKRIHAWLLPANGDTPRPPMPVSEFLPSAM
jgi:hypothetical protein